MDWAEELKMTIRKTTARKGRRSKSRDVLNEQAKAGPSSAASTHLMNKDISIDITLDVHNASSSPTATSATTSTTYNNEFDSSRPPIRRVSGGWADSGLKGLKSKKNSFDDERFLVTKSTTSSIPMDDIPVIPDMDDIKDDILLNEIIEPPSGSTYREYPFKALTPDLLSQKAFSAFKDDTIDLVILTRCLQVQENLDEPDDNWEWDKLFLEVSAQINSQKFSHTGVPEKIEIGPDEVPPAAKHN